MKLSDLLDVDNIDAHISAGHIAEVSHPTEPLVLLNYTNRCQFENAWDTETRTCRGLIYNSETFEVVARPFPKFHNLHEHAEGSHAGPVKLVPPLRVFDKLDGSLGISYRRPSDGGIAWATRGSFVSEQAEWATKWWERTGRDLSEGFTFLAEIIYPENRIVLDYGDRQGLVLLAVIGTESGTQVAPLTEVPPLWPGEVVELLGTVEDVGTIDRNHNPNSEGYVVLSGDFRTRVKLKTNEYMRLHKILTGCSTVTVWDMLRNGDSLDVLYDKVPDEFADWANETVSTLEGAYDTVLSEARYEFEGLRGLLPDRRAFAERALKSEYRPLLFRMADDKDLAPLVWKMVKPERTLPYLSLDESNA